MSIMNPFAVVRIHHQIPVRLLALQNGPKFHTWVGAAIVREKIKGNNPVSTKSAYDGCESLEGEHLNVTLENFPILRHALKVIFQNPLKRRYLSFTVECESFVGDGQGKNAPRFHDSRNFFEPTNHIVGVLDNVGSYHVVEDKAGMDCLLQGLPFHTKSTGIILSGRMKGSPRYCSMRTSWGAMSV